MKIKGYAVQAAKQKLESFEYESNIKKDEVLIKVSCCGVCHSDLHLVDNDWGMSTYPFIPGHEVVGVVEKIGSSVKNLKPKQRVGVGWMSNSCAKCDWCKKGEENLCSNQEATCVGRNGGFADYVVANSKFAFPIPALLPSEHVAPLLCGGITVYSPIKKYVKKGMRVGIVGIGGLGHLALQFANKFGAKVTAISSSADKEKEARKFGAHNFLNSTDVLKMKTSNGSFDFILSTVSADLPWSDYLALLDKKGVLCVVGASPGNISVSPFDLLMNQKIITGSAIGDCSDIKDMLKFAAKNKVGAMVEVLPMSKANEAIDKIKQNKARYRMVLKN